MVSAVFWPRGQGVSSAVRRGKPGTGPHRCAVRALQRGSPPKI